MVEAPEISPTHLIENLEDKCKVGKIFGEELVFKT